MKSSVLAPLPVLLVLIGCADPASLPPKTGTPGYYWQSALEVYGTGDYVKSNEHLSKILRSQNDFTARARVMQMVLVAGLLEANRELGDRFESGAQSTKGSTQPFRKRQGEARSMAANLAKLLGENYAALGKEQAQGDVTMAFPYPSRGALNPPPQINRIFEGQVLPESEVESVVTQMYHRGVLQQVSSFAAAPGDPAKAQAALKTLPLQVPRKSFELAAAKVLYEGSRLFSPNKRAEPAVQEFLADHASKALAAAAASDKEAKDLKAKIDKDLKDIQNRKRG